MRALQYGLVIPRRDSMPIERRRPRFRKRIVLAFQKPAAHQVAVSKSEPTAYDIFAHFIRGNKIPRVTGKPGALVKLRFTSRKNEFRALLLRYPVQIEVRMPNQDIIEHIQSEDETAKTQGTISDAETEVADVEMTEDIEESESASNAQLEGNRRDLPYMTRRRRRSDEWWDDGPEDRKRVHRTF